MTTLPSLAEAQDREQELNELAIRTTLARVRDGWALLVPWGDLRLAAAICDVPVPSQEDPLLTAPGPFRWSHTGRLLASVSLTLCLGAAGTVALAPELADGWLASTTGSHPEPGPNDRVFRSDDDGNGVVDRMVIRGADGIPTAVWVDRDQDGVVDRFLRVYPESGTALELRDDDGDGLPERSSGVGMTSASLGGTRVGGTR